MNVKRLLICRVVVIAAMVVLTACNSIGDHGAAAALAANGADSSANDDSHVVVRRGFLGAFFRAEGPPPYGVFSVYSKNRPPEPYPTPGARLFGKDGYCDRVADNGSSISSGNLVDPTKLKNIVNLGVKWTRTGAAPFFVDSTHISGPGNYNFGQFDSGQCALIRAGITPLIALGAGPVMYNVVPDQFSPKSVETYKSAADFGQWCGVIASHEKQVFKTVSRFSLPDNEVNGNPKHWPEGDPEIAAFSKACYRAIKAVEPSSTVYGFELNMDGNLDPAAFVQRLYDLGCKVGTCYDAISMHLSLTYPIPPPDTPCHPHPRGAYSMQCITDIQSAAHARVHVIIGETGYLVPGGLPNESVKAKAIVDAMETFAADPLVDGVNYANVDECDLYPTGFFVGGCIIDSAGRILPGYTALQKLAHRAF